MDRLDLGDDLLPIKIFGQDIDLKKPGMQQVLIQEQAVKEAADNPEAVYEVMRKFVISLGMPEEIANKMQLGQYLTLIDHLNSKKKTN